MTLEPVIKTCRCGRGTLHHLSCDEAHAHEYPKCGVDVCVKCQFNVMACKCKKVNRAAKIFSKK